MPMKSTTAVIATTLATTAFAAAATGIMLAPAASAAPGTEVYVGCTEHASKPGHISLSCADDAVNFDGITWQSWSSGKAVGTGTFNYNTCLPTCVAGNNVQAKKVKITLSKPKTAKGVRFFSVITADYPNGSGPAGMTSSTFLPYTPLTQ